MKRNSKLRGAFWYIFTASTSIKKLTFLLFISSECYMVLLTFFTTCLLHNHIIISIMINMLNGIQNILSHFVKMNYTFFGYTLNLNKLFLSMRCSESFECWNALIVIYKWLSYKYWIIFLTFTSLWFLTSNMFFCEIIAFFPFYVYCSRNWSLS